MGRLLAGTGAALAAVLVAGIALVATSVERDGSSDPLPMGGFATGHSLEVPGDLARIAEVAPGGFVRSDFSWRGVQPEGPGDFDWARLDARVAATRSAGLETLAVLAYTPSWANGGSSDDKVPPAPDMVGAWERFCYELARRYLPRGVRTFELWNEPNVQRFWKPAPDVEAYVDRVLRPGAAGIRRAAEERGVAATVLGGSTAPARDTGTSSSPTTFLAGMYEAGAQGSFDALAHHPYVWPAAPSVDPAAAAAGDAMAQTPELRALMVQAGDGGKRIWATEVGLTSRTEGPHHPAPGNDRFVSHQTYAERVPLIFDLWFGLDDGDDEEWVGPLLWHQVRNVEPEPSGRLTDPEHGFGFLFADGSDKPATPTPREALRDAFARYRGP